MQEAPRALKSAVPGKMGYEDFVYFILSEEDKGTDAGLRYWHRCIDLDDDGVITSQDMQCASRPLSHSRALRCAESAAAGLCGHVRSAVID